MEEILEELFLSLKKTFVSQLNAKDRKISNDGEIDVFKTFLSLSIPSLLMFITALMSPSPPIFTWNRFSTLRFWYCFFDFY